MSTVRIKNRRGLASEWANVNPVLAAGEMGLESDTNFIKFGNGTDAWNDLAYANEPLSQLENTLANYVSVGDVGNPGGPAGPLTVDGKIPSSQLDIAELAQDAVNSALVAGTGLDKNYNDSANTITINVDSTIATKTYADDAVSTHSSDTTSVHGISDTAELATKTFAANLLTNATKTNIAITGDKNGLTITAENGVADSTTDDLQEGTNNLYFTNERAQDAVGGIFEADSTLTLSYNDSANKIELAVNTENIASKTYTDTQLNYKADLNSPTFTGIPHAPNPSTGSNGTQIATTSFVQGLISDIVDGAPTALNTLNEIATALQGDETTLGALITTVDGKQDKVANISSTEIAALDGITSNIQDQLDSKLNSTTAASTYATSNNPTFTGTVTLPSGSITSAMINNGTIINEDISSVAAISPSKISGTAITAADSKTVTTELINDAAITTDKLHSTAVTTDKINNGAVNNDKLSSDAVHTINILDSAITTGKINDAAVTTVKINDSAITNAKLASDVVHTLNILDANVTTAKIADAGVTTAKINDSAVTHAKLASDAVETINIKDANVTNAKLAIDSVDTAQIKTDAVTNDKLASNSVNTAEIVNGAVTSDKIADATIVDGDISSTAAISQSKISGLTTDLAAKALASDLNTHTSATTTVHGIADTSKLVATTDTGTVTSAMIANGTIVNADISGTAAIAYSKLNLASSITSADIVDGTIATTNIADNAITSLKIADSSITSAKIADGTIVNADINASAAIAASKISGTAVTQADTGTVTNAMLAGSIAASKITGTAVTQADTGTVTNSMLAGSIAASKITGTAVTQADTGTVTSTMIADGTIVDADINASAAISQSKVSGLVSDLASKAPLASPTFTGTVSGVTKAMVGLGNVDNTSDANKPISTATQTALDGKASLSGATFTGAVNGTSLTLSGNLTVNGITSTVQSRTLKVEDNLIYLNDPISATITNASGNGTNITYTAANAFSDGDYVTITGITPSGFNISGTVTQSNANSFKVANTFQGTYTSGGTAYSRVEANPDLGFAGGYNDGTYHHAGLFRDASDSGKFKFFQGYIPEPTVDIDTTDVSFALAPIAVSSIEATSATIGSVTNTELQYVHGVTSAIQTQLDAKAPLASPTFTGTVTLPTGTVTSSMILDGTIVNADINASAAIAASKISGTAVTQADTGTVTNTMLAGSIAASKVTGTAVTQADTGTVTSTMILDGTIVNADINASAAIAQSKIANLTTDLAAKAPLAAPTFTGLVTVSSSGIAFSDKTQTLAGVPSRTPIASAISSSTTLAGNLQDNMVPLSGATIITIGDTSNALYAVGESVDFYQSSGTGAGFAATGSVNLRYTPGLNLRTTYSSATAQKISSTDWLIYGDLKA